MLQPQMDLGIDPGHRQGWISDDVTRREVVSNDDELGTFGCRPIGTGRELLGGGDDRAQNEHRADDYQQPARHQGIVLRIPSEDRYGPH